MRSIFTAADRTQQCLFVEWLGTFGRTARVNFRTMALDVVAALMTTAADGATPAQTPLVDYTPLYELILSRVHDRMPRCADMSVTTLPAV